MAYTISITETLNTVTAITTSNVIAVTVEDNVVNTTVTNVTIDVLNQLNTVTVYTDAIELRIDDFASIFKGDWVSGTTYGRGELVNSTSSLYVSIVNTFTTFVSTIAPQNDPTKWTRVVWHEAPFAYINVAGTATVGSLLVGGGIGGQGLVINSTATFNGVANFNSTTNFNTVTNVADLYINGLRFPPNKGVYGQVLYTNGVNQALWSDINDLLYWVLSSDLTTQGFNIVTGFDALVPNPQLTIGSGITGNLRANLKFQEGGTTATLSATSLILTGTNINLVGSTNITSLTAPGATLSGGTVYMNGLTVGSGQATSDKFVITGGNSSVGTAPGVGQTNNDSLTIYGRLIGTDQYWAGTPTNTVNAGYYPLSRHKGYIQLEDQNPSGSGPGVYGGSGILFSDGTKQITANVPGLNGPQGPQGPTGPSVFVWKGAWYAEQSYTVNDVVPGTGAGFGSTFVAIQDVPANSGYYPDGNSPTYWALVASRGAEGARGPQGPQGPIGYTGSLGSSGPSGPAGGYTGSAGYTGSVGPSGPPNGYTGSQGSIGYTGSEGPQGPRGYTGSASTVAGPSGPTYSLPVASTTTRGGVLIGNNIAVEYSGMISVSTATTATLGLVRIGNGISVSNTGTISVSTLSNQVSLASDLYTNGYKIGRDATGINTTNTYLVFESNSLRLQSSTSTILTLSNTTATIAASTTTVESSTMFIKTSFATIVGSDIYNSRLRANEMTSFSGVGPVQFVHGIQFDDNTTQITAWQPDQLNIRVVDFGSI